MNILSKNWFVASLLIISLFFSAVAGFWMFTRISFGNYDFFKQLLDTAQTPIRYATDISRREFLILLPFLFLVILFGIKPNLLIDFVENSLIHGVIDINNKQHIGLVHQMVELWTDPRK